MADPRRPLTADLRLFLVRHPAWWIVPPLAILIGLALLVVGTAGGGLAGFVYDL